MYDEANEDDEELEEITEDFEAEEYGDEDLNQMKNKIGNLDSQIRERTQALGETETNINLLTNEIKID